MYIQRSGQSPVGVIQDLPNKLLARLAIGQQLEAIVTKPAVVAEIVAIKVADSLLAIRTPEALQAGQKIQLELIMQNGKPALKFVDDIHSARPNDSQTSIDAFIKTSLKKGQSMAVEVIKVLADQRVLLQTPPPNKQQIDVDISHLNQRYKVGDKIAMDVLNVKPLTVQLRDQSPVSEQQRIQDRIKQILAHQSDSPSLDRVSKTINNNQIPDIVRQPLQQLLHLSLDKSALTQVDAFKQALSTSGVFTEKQLLTDPTRMTHDFKANILKIMQAVQTVLDKSSVSINERASLVFNNLPAQVEKALVLNGRTSTQLLATLLSGTALTRSELMNAMNQTLSSGITTPQQAKSLLTLLTQPDNQTLLPRVLAELQMLLKDMEGVHNKLQLNQLHMLKEPESANMVASWLFDVPIKDKQTLELLQLQIDQHQHHDDSDEDEDEDIWSVKLNLDTQNLGPLQATVTMQGLDVKIVLRSERPSSARLLQENIALLHQALAKLEVTISHTSCCCGPISKPTALEMMMGKVVETTMVDISV